jgi:hypothetical protein
MDPTAQSSAAVSQHPNKKGGWYLSPRAKIWISAACFASMIAASLFAVFQPLNPNPLEIRPSTWFWYPIESNVSVRLQSVHCTN